MKNKYEIRGDVVVIMLNSTKYGDHETIISIDKLDKANEFPNKWYIHSNPTTRSLYVVGNTPAVNGKRRTINLHRWLMDAPEDMQVDHINHNTLNNTDENLRIVTLVENLQNKSGSYRNSKSGIRGVSWRQSHNKWRAYVNIGGKPTHIGYFDDVNDAEQAVIEARLKYMPFSNESI